MLLALTTLRYGQSAKVAVEEADGIYEDMGRIAVRGEGWGARWRYGEPYLRSRNLKSGVGKCAASRRCVH